jgi:hypothetical protein
VCFLNGVKMPQVLGKAQLRGKILRPQDLRKLMFARQLHHRYLSGDYRHDEDVEVDMLREACQYVQALHAEMEGTPVRVVEVEKSKMRRHERLPSGFYEERAPQLVTQLQNA